jgi:bifunctional DNA-binding transcriptional regulator/antitoxin component of YhaV-PrlF toxin-antitoxin module
MSSDQIGMPHLKYISSLLEGFVETITAFIDKHDLKKRIVIHVLTDHGSTTIPADIANDLDLSGFKSTEFTIRSPRYIVVSKEKFSRLPDNWKEDCFFLDATEFGNDSHYLSARRGNRFVKTDDNFFAHGGLSPEEIIVPHLIFEAVKASLQDLTLLLARNEFRYRKERIVLEIGNPNDFAVENIRISVINSNIDTDQATIDVLNGKTKSAVEMSAQFKQTANVDERDNLILRIRFTCRDEKHEQSATMPIKMRAMVETKGKSAFDDLE